jgi:hypothetical protein
MEPIIKRFKLKNLYDEVKNENITRSQFRTWINSYGLKHWMKGVSNGERMQRERFERRAQAIANLNKTKGEANETNK